MCLSIFRPRRVEEEDVQLLPLADENDAPSSPANDVTVSLLSTVDEPKTAQNDTPRSSAKEATVSSLSTVDKPKPAQNGTPSSSAKQATVSSLSTVGKANSAPEDVPLKLQIICATGLRNADFWGKSDPYCTCEISGKPASKVQTETVDNCLDPIWNFEVELNGYTPGDDLVFHVFDEDWGKVDDLLGRVVLPSTEFHPGGLERELELSDSGTDVPAFLRVCISPVPAEFAPAAPKRDWFSSLPLRNNATPTSCLESDPAGVHTNLVEDQPLKLTVIGGHRLPNMDWGSKSDPYCVVEIPGKPGSRKRTRTIDDNLDPMWQESFEITEHAPGDSLVFAVYDEDWGKNDDLLGFVTVPYSDYHPHGFHGELPLSMKKTSRKGVLEGLWQTKDSQRVVIKKKSVMWSDGSKDILAPRGRNQISVTHGEQVLSAQFLDSKLIWDHDDVWTRAEATISVKIEPAVAKINSVTGFGIRKNLFGIDRCQLNSGSITGLGIRQRLKSPMTNVKTIWEDKKRTAQLAVIKMSKPYRDKVMTATRDALKSNLTADPDMWPGFRHWIHSLVDDLWHDISEEVEASIFEAKRGVEGMENHNVQSLGEMGERPTCFSPLWFRAYILYHFLPYDRSLFGQLRDPAFLVFTMLSLMPGLRVVFFVLLLMLLICPGPPDEFQLVQYIMMFKGTQFLSSGVFMALYGGILYYNCVHRNGIHTCHAEGPGTSQASWIAIVDMVGCSLLVWLGFFFLPMTQKAAGLKVLNFSHGSADVEARGMGITADDATPVINVAAENSKASNTNVGPTRTLLASSLDGKRVELKVEDDGSGRHKWFITPAGVDRYHIQILGGVRGGRFLTRNNRQVTLGFQDGSDCQLWELTKNDSDSKLYQIQTPASDDQQQSYLAVLHKCGRALGLQPEDDGSGRHWWRIPALDAESRKRVWKVFGHRCHSGRGGRLRRLLLYDVYCFLGCLALLVALSAAEIYRESNITVMELPCVDKTTLTKSDVVPELLKRTFQLKAMHFKAALYWARVVYSLLAIPFTFFNIPVLQAILTHTTATGFNRRGVAVAYLLPPCPDEAPPSVAELVDEEEDDDPSP